MTRYIPQKSVNTIVLAYFFARAQTASPGVTDSDLERAFGNKLGAIRVQMAREDLRKASFIFDANPQGETWVWALNSLGYSKAEELYLSDEHNAARMITEKGLDAYFEHIAASPENSSSDDIPASDRYVTVRDNMAGYQEIVQTVDAADDAIRGDNALPADERSWIRIHLELGITLIKRGGKVLTSAVKSLLLEPLEAALKESTQENVKKAIGLALRALRTYLGIF